VRTVVLHLRTFAEPASSQLFNDQLDEVADAAAAIPSAEVKSKHQPRR
jgi:hypothetical protein